MITRGGATPVCGPARVGIRGSRGVVRPLRVPRTVPADQVRVPRWLPRALPWRSLVFVAALVAPSVSSVVAIADGHADDPTAPASPCQRPVVDVATDAPGTATPGGTAVRFSVLPTTWLRVADGGAVAAATNTGCPPHADDVMLVGDRAATAELRAAAVATFASGDWSHRGEWHRAP